MSGASLQLGAERRDGALAPVVFHTEIVETNERIDNNIRATLEKPYKPFMSIAMQHFLPVCSIVGSAPSVEWSWRYARGDIIACNAAHDLLVRNKVTPKYAMLWDPVAVVEEFVTPHDDVTYLVASRCHRGVFKRLEKHKVVVWHADGDPNILSLLEQYRKMEPIVMGGSTAVMRSCFLAVAMGYHDLHLFGVDSSSDGGTHFKKSVVTEEYMDINCLGRWFRTTSWLAVQAEDFKKIVPYLRLLGVKFTIYGDGLIPHIAKAMGLTVIERASDVRQLRTA